MTSKDKKGCVLLILGFCTCARSSSSSSTMKASVRGDLISISEASQGSSVCKQKAAQGQSIAGDG